MLAGGRVAAAIEVLADIDARHRPASEGLADWGRSHRFAGSADRSAIGDLVYDALRSKRSIAWCMGEDTPRALAIGAFARSLVHDVERIDTIFAGDRHAPQTLSDAERIAIRKADLSAAPDDVKADLPAWLWPTFQTRFGSRAGEEGAALASRAPLDLRVNTLKADRDKVLKSLSKYSAEPTPWSPLGVRIAAKGHAGRLPNVQADAAFQKGWFEIQDEGSQICALLSGAGPGMQVADLCAGAGGKTLALAALMQNKGQLHAYDADRHRLKGIFERLKRAGTRNVQVLEAGVPDQLAALTDRMDVVFVDAPCSGSGVWRRRPDAKWRLNEQTLASRLEDQRQVLDMAVPLVKPGGRLIYVTCSLLLQENEAQVGAFLARHSRFDAAALGMSIDGLCAGIEERLLLTPARHGCDGFFAATLRRKY